MGGNFSNPITCFMLSCDFSPPIVHMERDLYHTQKWSGAGKW